MAPSDIFGNGNKHRVSFACDDTFLGLSQP